MIQIMTNGEPLDLRPDFSIEIEDTNPIYHDRGSQTLPANIPATRRNICILKAPHRLDTAMDPNNPECDVQIFAGAYIRRGKMNITEASLFDGITFNIGFDNSTAYAGWINRKLSDLNGLPTYMPQLHEEGDHLTDILDDLYRLYREADPVSDDFAIFPCAVNNESLENNNIKKTYWEVLNVVGEAGLSQPSNVNRVIDGEVTDVKIPRGYMVTPFLRVWRILELAFDDLGLTIKSNPFKEDLELARIVVLNNTADAVCQGKVKYSELMPDVTVQEFLDALWVRFGLVYDINFNSGTVSLALLKDILRSNTAQSLDSLITDEEIIKYEKRQYLKLAASTGIEGAAPCSERFEDFINGYDISSIRLGANVNSWKIIDPDNDPHWDGDLMDGYWDDYDPWDDPEWDDDRDDDRDTRSTSAAKTKTTSSDKSFLAREFVSGQWYHLDATNGVVKSSSSPFFIWDPKTEDATASEQSSVDECVPIGMVSTYGLNLGNPYKDMTPLYLVGTRHFNSYIKGNDSDGKEGNRTPLAFMLAFTSGNKTIGRISPEGDDGMPLVCDDGSRPELSLLFQFNDGLFARFWADYDEILRHGNRLIELNTVVDKSMLSGLNMLQPYSYKGVRVMIDSISYSLPAGNKVAVKINLRTIQTHGNYDIVSEQNIPTISSAARSLKWFLYSETFGNNLDTPQSRKQAVDKFIDDNIYFPHTETDGYWYIDSNSAVLTGLIRISPSWQEDTTLPRPGTQGQRNSRFYKALLEYQIFEINDSLEGTGFSESPAGTVRVETEYEVILYSKWVTA